MGPADKGVPNVIRNTTLPCDILVTWNQPRINGEDEFTKR